MSAIFYPKSETSSAVQIAQALSSSGSQVSVSSDFSSGTRIATISVDGTPTALYSPPVPTDLSSFTNSPGYLSSVPDAYKTYSETRSTLSSDGYVTEGDLSSTLGSVSLSSFQDIPNPNASVNSIQSTLLSILTLLKGGTL